MFEERRKKLREVLKSAGKRERIVISDERAFEILKGAKILNIHTYDGEYSSEYAEFMVIETDKGKFEIVACGCSLGWSLHPQKNSNSF